MQKTDNSVSITKEKVLIFWSGGKNSALLLHKLKADPRYEIMGLVTIFDRQKNIVRYHGIPDSLIIEQAKMLNLPLQRIFLPTDCSETDFKEQVGKILAMFGKKGIRTIAFGDVHPSKNFQVRKDLLNSLEMKDLYPLWEQNTKELASEFLSLGHKALITAVMTEKLDMSYLACEYNQAYLERLPTGIDPSGENGEFHTFVVFSPHFKSRVQFSKAVAADDGAYLVSLVKEP